MTAKHALPTASPEKPDEVTLLANILRAAVDGDDDAVIWCHDHAAAIAAVLAELRRRRGAK